MVIILSDLLEDSLGPGKSKGHSPFLPSSVETILMSVFQIVHHDLLVDYEINYVDLLNTHLSQIEENKIDCNGRG